MSTTAATDTGNPMPAGHSNAENFFALGLMYANGNSVPADMIAAHKWFNIAAMRGDSEHEPEAK